MLKNKLVVLGVTGGIAAYKAADIASRLKKIDINVKVIMTKHSKEFISPLTMQSISQNHVSSDMFEEPKSFDVEHIALAKAADLFLIAPATANFIGKLSSGIADDMLTTTVMATKAPVLIAPAMNTNMYLNPITQENIERLMKLKYKFIKPDSGRLACGDLGIGKLAPTEDIVEEVINLLSMNTLYKDKNVLVTAGPTIEDIDPFRYITNNSSGKMGYSIARRAYQFGANVTLISGETNLKIPQGVNFIKVRSSKEMLDEVIKYKDSDYVFMAAAVSDYTPENFSDIKVKKQDSNLNIALKRTTDILKTLGADKKDTILVGFAAETNNIKEYAKNKIKSKNLDYIIANDISQPNSGFKSDNNTVLIIDKFGIEKSYENMPKNDLAYEILEYIGRN
ncbi:bifunctional phosphopantothenoylcysteine decarboxylase/phosphopantothenate--cysteine ligase CoaBC [Helicovermis profundi]|uniref:Coenzyme A biosynthesis bifunctional protein CoaBC n=1 Tax=Helicovermis profundi TaxID=3065157 RepID=A0AAU9ESN8_9FIRM|nr:bifunctional phosphopantothenoylcysteine decarboxylase/phosphopantothenate--cysteine ligase CoaBC [Clostridia bacterium S502]